ncbi:efflux RND transporter periplasmic adaptor subunit [Marinicella rhabdoformis]|uniref:efflux RND transporter periplasmic adaptor subunit n=1 Tax=Marinicella rhabdoformis TaxID=2580566 RepID=UPI0012AEC9D0|nr:efflux RND transporter periplasmic adaptor subunit [Marinicella rhabdoformis]
MNKITWLVFGTFLGLILAWFWNNTDKVITQKIEKKQPLYWVAPMDDNYRRDEPGLSPMGMALVPVYENQPTENLKSGAGTIQIDAAVINNMGVRTAEVSYGHLQQSSVSQGVVRFAETTMHHVHPKTVGWIRELAVKSSDEWVEKGQLLYRIYAPEWVNVQQELLFAVQQKNSSLIQAAEQRLAALQFPSEVIKQVKAEQRIFESVPFKAPQSGYVIELNVREGHVVKPADTMMTIANNDTMWLDTEWFSSQNIQQGQKVAATSRFYPQKRWSGSIDYIYPSADEQNRSIKTRTLLENPNGLLKAHMNLQVQLVNELTSTESNRLLVPHQAVIQTAQQNRVVLVLGNGVFKSVAVELGETDGQAFEVVSGLKSGDKVVTSAQFLLDSESSKTSDFIRMGDDSWPSAVVSGRINDINLKARMINISRSAITKWNRPAATLDFQVENTTDLSTLSQGDDVTFEFEIREDQFVIISIQKQAEKQVVKQLIRKVKNHD